ncbi:MAG: DsbA family protein [bacterium]
MQTNRMGSILTSVLVLCALTVTGLVVRRELFPPGALLPTARHIDNWRDYQNAGHAVGPKNAAVTIVEFADYECPACGIFAPVLSAVQARHPDDVRIVYRHLPIPLHRFAMPSAVGAECAAHQGRFIQMHDALYKDQKSFGTRSWTAFATEAGVPNVHAFEACTADSTIVATVQKDLQDALALGAHATPTLLVNGDMTSGTVSDGVLEAMIERARRAHR